MADAVLPIYLDHHATTPCDPRVVDAMLPYLTDAFGNAASKTHAFGWQAEAALEAARASIARDLGADPRELVFTSGATEANNLAILGAVRAAGAGGRHVVTCRTEHNAVLDPCRALEKNGVRVTALSVDRAGHLDLDALRDALESDTVLVSIMHANNEIGVVHDLAAIGRITRERGVLLHSDAAQSVGKLSVDVEALGVDLLSFTAHKIYGPKGIGALYVRRAQPRIQLEPLVYGGGHERGLRSGTVPVALCVALAAALEIAVTEREAEAARLRALRERLWQRLQSELDDVYLNGDAERRLPGNLNISFGGVEGESLIVALDDVAVSTGSACTSAKQEPSHVLRALGLPAEQALGALRFGLGRGTTEDDIDHAATRVVEQVRRLRELSPLWSRRGRHRV
jgi:cysteine desulfurase